MTRMSPAVARTVSVLNFFGDHPGQAFTLTDIIRSLKLSRATCHALLAALVEAGYLYRTSDKSYILGPALARVAMVAQQSLSPLQVAAPEMRALADEFDAICSAVFQEKDEAVVRERAASVSHLGWSISPGSRIPLRPPFGSVFMAWSSEAEIAAWIGRMTPPATDEQRAHMRAGLEFPHAHGFAFGVRRIHILDERHAQSLVYNTEQTDYLVSALDSERDYDLAFVAAPVFDVRAKVAFVLALMGFIHTVRGVDVERIGLRLRATCDRITGFIGGKMPA